MLLAELSSGFCLKKIWTLGEESSASKGARKPKMGSWSSSIKLEASYSRTLWHIHGDGGKTFYWCPRETWRWISGLTGFLKRIITFLLDSPSEPSTNNSMCCVGIIADVDKYTQLNFVSGYLWCLSRHCPSMLQKQGKIVPQGGQPWANPRDFAWKNLQIPIQW